ncbi:hypothetical protein CUPS4244_03710 [Campylobacter upsaliensis]|uniref:hypothetical protein n=1 Tax=Campylobacter upsaliensis TaxID=28080 RepID=UPI002149C893|nr:hypothetical protein [Campylobacter upsaliensis]MCR2104195.1 hypothetical protein [Campylobacter upsaliensis]
MNSKTITLLKRILKAKKLSLPLLIAIIVFVFSFNQGFNAFLPQSFKEQNLEKELKGQRKCHLAIVKNLNLTSLFSLLFY